MAKYGITVRQTTTEYVLLDGDDYSSEEEMLEDATKSIYNWLPDASYEIVKVVEVNDDWTPKK